MLLEYQHKYYFPGFAAIVTEGTIVGLTKIL
jgi:hypothetical protein